MDALEIRLLGSPDVLWQGESVRIPRRSLRAMLFFLACNGQISRSELYSRFWPDESEPKAQANLRTALNRLRKALPDPTLVVVTPDYVLLDRERVVVDVIEFKNLVAQTWQVAAQLPVTALLPEWVVRQMRQAVQLWRSSHFMAGFAFPAGTPELDHWQSITGQVLEGDYLRLLVRLGEHFSMVGDLDTALRYLLPALEVDPFDSELNARALRYMLSLNRSNAARAFAETLLTRYAGEAEDLPEDLLELCRRAQRGEDETRESLEIWPAWLRSQVRLVNRGAELQQLLGAYRRGGTVVLWGEAGSGKTRLAYEFNRTLFPQPRLLLLSAFQMETSLPYQALIDALRRGITPQEWQDLPWPWRQQMAYLLPELSEPHPPDGPMEPLSGDILLGNLFEALRQLFIKISGSRKVLVVLDQAQWADESTLTALAYLVDRGFFADHGMLLVAARLEEPAPALNRFIQQSRTQKSMIQMWLGPLNKENVAELAQLVLDRPLEERQVDRLAVETGGTPLFILETLRALIENAPASGLSMAFDKLPVGSSLYVLLQERLNRLQPATRQAAEAAAVIGDEFAPEMIEAVAQMEPETVVQALDELVRTHMVQVVYRNEQVAYAFSHRQFVEVIQWVSGPARLRLLHLRAAQALEASQADALLLAASLAQHYEAAGETRQAIQYWLKAGQRAMSLVSISEAVRAYEAADRLVQRSNDTLPDRLLHELYTRWGEIAFEQADVATLQQLVTRLQRLGEERHSGLLSGGALRGLGDLCSLLKEPERAQESFRQAEFYLQPAGEPIELARLYQRWGIFYYAQMRYAEAQDILERALDLAGPLDATTDAGTPAGAGSPSPGGDGLEVRAAVECGLGMVYNATGWPDKAQAIVGRSLWRLRTIAVMYGHWVMSVAKLHSGERLASLEHARLGMQISQNIPNTRMTAAFMASQARAALSLGQLDDAWETLRSAMELAQANRHIDQLTLIRSIFGDMYRLLGDLPRAIQSYQAGLEEGEGKEDLLACQVLLAQALADSGERERALPLVEQAYQQARSINLASTFIPALATWALILSQAGQNEASYTMMEEWLQVIQGRNYRSYTLVEKVVLFQRAYQRQDLAEARALAVQGIEMGRSFGSPWWELLGYQLLRLLGPLDAQAVIQVEGIFNRIQQNGRHPDLQSLVKRFIIGRRDSLLAS